MAVHMSPDFTELDTDLFVAESWIRFYGVPLQTRTSVVRLGNGGLWVHSPAKPDDESRRQLARLGPVRFVVSPNKIHNLFLGEFALAYPEARVYAPPGLPERRPELRYHGVLGPEPELEWAEDLDQTLTAGNVFFSEALFLHRASGTLIVGDLVENIGAAHTTPLGCRLLRLLRAYDRPVASPEFRYYTVDAEAARRVLEKVARWPFRRILLAHGALIEEDAVQQFRQVCEELLTRIEARPRFVRALFERLARLQ